MHKTEEPELKEDENCGQDKHDKLLSATAEISAHGPSKLGSPEF